MVSGGGLAERLTFGWVIATEDETLAQGNEAVDGIQTSHRAEGGGFLAGIHFLCHLCTYLVSLLHLRKKDFNTIKRATGLVVAISDEHLADPCNA